MITRSLELLKCFGWTTSRVLVEIGNNVQIVENGFPAKLEVNIGHRCFHVRQVGHTTTQTIYSIRRVGINRSITIGIFSPPRQRL